MLYTEISNQIAALDTSAITEERRGILEPLITYLKRKYEEGDTIRLNFICTHNSRRSHLSQIWAQTMASFFKVPNVFCYSGGTEATAMFPKVGETLKNQGFNILQLSQDNNPVYAVKFAENEAAVIAFSKAYSDVFNPKAQFAAVMTCSSADAGCPVVFGSDLRVPITYEDPKKSDGTPQQTETYYNRSLQIATEMKYVFSQVK